MDQPPAVLADAIWDSENELSSDDELIFVTGKGLNQTAFDARFKKAEVPTSDEFFAFETLTTPDPLPFLPSVFKTLTNWVRWKLESVGGKETKIPYQANGKKASSTAPATWTDYRMAVADQRIDRTEGVGFVLTKEVGIVGFDLDGCLNSATGEIAPWAKRMMNVLDSYTEITPSGMGLRIFVRGVKPDGKHKFQLALSSGFGDKVQIEVYDHARYYTMTGNRLGDATEVAERDITEAYKLCHDIQQESPADKAQFGAASLDESPSVGIKTSGSIITTKLALLMRGEIVSRSPFVVQNASGNSIEYPSQSEADLALATLLAMKHGDDPGKIDEEFRGSSLYREKWERDDYRTGTIRRAIASASATETSLPSRAQVVSAPTPAPVIFPEYAMTPDEIEAELDKEYPRIPLATPPGPTWDDGILYGPAGDLTRAMAQYNEGHPAGIYLNLLISLGNAFGRSASFRVNQTKHYTNEFLANVGQSSYGRKGSARAAVNEFMKLVDPEWTRNCVLSGFGSGEAIISAIRDDFEQTVTVKDKKGGPPKFEKITVPGVADKRLCIRESELASIFTMASRTESLAGAIIRNGWDGSSLSNNVKGQSKQGISNSARCEEPHVSITGDISKEELKSSLPQGSENNGFGNRFLYCYVHRTQKCPNGGPSLDFAPWLLHFHEVIKPAKKVGVVPLSKSAEKVWARMYLSFDESGHRDDLTAKMTSRGPAHVRRLATILALIDLSDTVDTKHIHAARTIWDYCDESARYIFQGTTLDQMKLASWVGENGPVTAGQVRRNLYHDNREAAWVRAQLLDLVKQGKLALDGETFSVKT